VFTGIRRQRLQLVWGPPGTGKTHFLALTILNLMATSYKVGVPFRVCVSAFTHNAIDNVLARVRSLLEVAKGVKDEDRSGWRDLLAIVRAADCESLSKVLAQDYVVVGATCWALHRGLLDDASVAPIFDMVLVDEGSQVPVADGAIVVSCLKPDTGRLVVCGDHLQLAPILQMVYPAPAPGEPLLYRSFLQCLMRHTNGEYVRDSVAQAQYMGDLPCVGMLRENHRMNAQLTNFSKRLYGSSYEFLRDRTRLAFDAGNALSARAGDFLQRVMDTRASLATVILQPQGVDDLEATVLATPAEEQVCLVCVVCVLCVCVLCVCVVVVVCTISSRP
jgi:DNA replication ATP-dependent helicase Dna2